MIPTPEQFARWQKAYDEGYKAGPNSSNPYLGKPDKLLEMNGWEMGYSVWYGK